MEIILYGSCFGNNEQDSRFPSSDNFVSGRNASPTHVSCEVVHVMSPCRRGVTARVHLLQVRVGEEALQHKALPAANVRIVSCDSAIRQSLLRVHYATVKYTRWAFASRELTNYIDYFHPLSPRCCEYGF